MNKNLKRAIKFGLITVLLFSGCTNQNENSGDEMQNTLVPRWMDDNDVVQNPYLSMAEASIHNDVYNSDVTAKAMPLGIYPEIIEGISSDSPNSPPAFFYDNLGRAIAPFSQLMDDGSVLSGGIAIRDMDSSNLEVKGKFLPYLDDNNSKYGIQISYSFVDKDNYLIGPTTNGHVVMIRTTDENNDVLPVFEKVLDVDIVGGAIKALGDDIDKNLLSLVYDYNGNLWFVTGGFHKNPAYSKAGFWGYLDREYIDRYLAGEGNLNAEEYLHYTKLADGENAENGIAAHMEGCVILTNQACYLLDVSNGNINTRWKVPYESSGGKNAQKDSEITGAGLAWGGGSSPTLTKELVLFTDNQKIVNLIAVNIKTGEIVIKTPVLDLGDKVTVSIENSISVYAPDSKRVSVLVCNWFGAGNANIFNPDADSSVQSYNNLYDDNWRENGSKYLMPGVERIDILKNKDGTYQAKSIWQRDDLKDTSMIKFASGAGYYYGYTQDEKTSKWGFFALDYDTGKTLFWKDVSKQPSYNNIAVGIMQGNNGNAIYCPTNSQVLVRLQDRFAYLPDEPDKKLDIVKMERKRLSDADFKKASNSKETVASYLLSATVEKVKKESHIAFRINGLNGSKDEYTAYYMSKDGKLKKIKEFKICDEKGKEISKKLNEKAIYELRVKVNASSEMNIASKEETVTSMVILAKK